MTGGPTCCVTRRRAGAGVRSWVREVAAGRAKELARAQAVLWCSAECGRGPGRALQGLPAAMTAQQACAHSAGVTEGGPPVTPGASAHSAECVISRWQRLARR